MRKHIAIVAIVAASVLGTTAANSFAQDNTGKHIVYQYKQFTAIESVIPGGMGRSRILTTDDNGQMLERDLKNFYSMVGINFENIANNDRAIVDRLNEFSDQGWDLVQVTTGNNQQSNGGLFITRYVFRKPK